MSGSVKEKNAALGSVAALTPNPSASSNPIEARGLGRRFGKRWVVRGLDLAVPGGSITALLGRNGAGKSTTIQMLLGLLPPTEGDVKVLGQDPRRLGSALFRDVAYVSERRELLDDLSIDAISRLVAEAHGARFDHDAFEAMRARYKLARDARCAVLSKGQRARLLLALSLAARPKVLVLDEPTSGLDVIVRDDFLEAIATFVAQDDGEPRAVLLSTHIIEDVSRICDRAIVIREEGPALAGDLEDLRAACSRYVIRLTGVLPPGDELRLPRGAVLLERDPRALTVAAMGVPEHVEAELDSAFPVAGIERHAASFKEAFTCWTEPHVGPARGGA